MLSVTCFLVGINLGYSKVEILKSEQWLKWINLVKEKKKSMQGPEQNLWPFRLSDQINFVSSHRGLNANIAYRGTKATALICTVSSSPS